MDKDNGNDLSRVPDEPTEGLDGDFELGDSWPVCPKCLTPCHPLQNYCANCDSNQAINPLASYVPFVNIRFNYGAFGIMWRKIWYDKETSKAVKWLYLTVIILFTPIVLIFGLPTVLTERIENPELRNTVKTVAYFVLIFLVTFLLISWLLRPIALIGPVVPYHPERVPY
ncbi:MAG: hypothetical protein ACYS4W_06645 [Planctomycetota bacterium]